MGGATGRCSYMSTDKVVATNREAYHNYHIIETHECGIALTGTEVKSIREGRCNLKDSYGQIRNGEAWLYNAHISPYSHGHRDNHEPTPISFGAAQARVTPGTASAHAS